MDEVVLSYDQETSTLGDRIEAARNAKGMTREDLADRLGVKKSTIKKWENDQSEPRSNRLYMMAGVIDCHVMWLLNGEGDTPLEYSEHSREYNAKSLKAELNDLNRDIEKLSRRVQLIAKQI